MKVKPTTFKGLFVITPTPIEDQRGYFMESYNAKILKRSTGMDYAFVQDNQSKSKYGVLRGLHFQKPPYEQTKLIRVLSGKILDAVVDIRNNSPTYGKSYSILLSSQNKKQLIIPRGFAHGFSVLSDTAEILYKCDQFYNKESEGGLMYNDKSFEIDWKIPDNKVILSEKDKNYPFFDAFLSPF